MTRLTLSSRFVRPLPKYALASILVAFGGCLFGLDTGTIGPISTMPAFVRTLGPFSSTLHGLVVSSILLPAALASFFAGHLADAVGRVRALAVGGCVFGLGAAIEASAVTLGMLFGGRVITGIGEGLFLSTLVVYICEIAPPSKRGVLASGVQLMVTFGLCVGYFVCYGTVKMSGNISWRVPFALQAGAAVLWGVASLLLLPESPRWLTAQGRRDEAGRNWEVLGVGGVEREKEQEQVALQERIATQETRAKKRWTGELVKVFGKSVWQRTLLGVFLMGMQQLSGIDGVLYYAPLLFQQAGLSSSESSFLASGVSALLIFVVTIPAFLLSDRWGRRTSTIAGGLACAVCMILIGSMYASNSVHGDHGVGRWVVIVAIYIFALAFAVTWAVGIKIYASEIQPPETRATASSLAYSSNWIVNWIVAFTTPIFLASSSSGVYFLFGGATLVTAVVCTLFMPETRGRSLEEINESFDHAAAGSVKSSMSRIEQRLKKFVGRGGSLAQRHTAMPGNASANASATSDVELDFITVHQPVESDASKA